MLDVYNIPHWTVTHHATPPRTVSPLLLGHDLYLPPPHCTLPLPAPPPHTHTHTHPKDMIYSSSLDTRGCDLLTPWDNSISHSTTPPPLPPTPVHDLYILIHPQDNKTYPKTVYVHLPSPPPSSQGHKILVISRGVRLFTGIAQWFPRFFTVETRHTSS